MDTTEQYRVIFSGQTRSGFSQDKVRETFIQKLRLSPQQAQRLFDGNHTLKRTSSREEAQRYVQQLARLGAVTRIEQGAGKRAANQDKGAQGSASHKDLPRYSPLPRNLLFRPWLYLSASLEVLLTLLYLALLLGILNGIFQSAFGYWGSDLLGNPLAGLVIQLLAAALGAVVLALLAKPLLSLPNLRHRGVLIPAEQEPDLHMFVEDLCERFNLPVPQEIRLNNDVTVQMRHYRGPAGFWKGQTVLTIGVPLMATMRVSQLAALIAHAMYCFRPTKSPRSSFLVMASNQWQHRAIYGEDAIDRTLARWEQEGRLATGLVKALQKLFARSRQLMELRLILSRKLERRLVHRLIAEADKRALALAGSEGLRHMFEQQQLLAHAVQELMPKLEQKWYESGSLPQDVIQLIKHRVRSYPANSTKRLRQLQEQQKATTGDIIPSDAQRLRSLGKHQLSPSYDCLSPANTVLHYFSKLSLSMSLRFYHNRLHIPVTPDKLSQETPKGSVEHKLNTVINGYFHLIWAPLIPLRLGESLQRMPDAAEARNQWQKAMKQIKRDHNQARHEHDRFLDAETALLDDSLHETLYQAEMWRALGEKKPGKAELEEFYQHCRESENHYEESLKKLGLLLKPYSQRLGATLTLLKFQAARGSARSRALYEEAVDLIAVNDRIEAIHTPLRELRLNCALLQVLLSYHSGKKRAKLNDRIEEKTSDIRQTLTTVRVALKDVLNPYPTPRGGKYLMDYLLLESYSEQTPEGDFDRGNDVVIRVTALQKRILSRLVVIAQQVEAKLL